MKQSTKHVYERCNEVMTACKASKQGITAKQYELYMLMLSCQERFAETQAAKKRIMETTIVVNHYRLINKQV